MGFGYTSSAILTMSIARTTPAQKPRGAARTTFLTMPVILTHGCVWSLAGLWRRQLLFPRSTTRISDVSFEVRKIDSPHNPTFKLWRNYLHSPEEISCPWIAVEGLKQIRELCRSLPIRCLVCTEEPADESLVASSQEAFRVPNRLFKKLTAVRSDQGVLAFFDKPSWDWGDIPSYVLYLWELQDPGNVGTLLRTCLASGVCSVVSSPRSVSFFNNKVVRASSAALLRSSFLQGISLNELRTRGYRVTAAVASEGESLFKYSFRPPEAVVIGSEGPGLPESVTGSADSLVHIPMSSQIESLNASVVGSLIAYEIFRRCDRAAE